jgi:predicted TIM-barrel fold metal-dependent hydrolase
MDATLYTQPKIDCHCHVLDPNGFAYASDVSYQPAGPETGSAQYFAHVLEAYGVQHALLVGPNSGYGTDNRCLLDAIANSKGRFKGIAVVANQTSLNELADLKGHGIVGIAFNYALHGLAHYQTNTALLEHLAALGMFVQVQTIEDQLATLTPALLGCGAQILIDHCGRPTLPQRAADAGMDALLALAQCQRATVKLSGFSKFSAQSYPFADAQALVQVLLQAFGPEHCIWASDWPFLRAPQRLDYGPLLQLFASAVPDANQRRAILWDTPRRLFSFGATTANR